MNKWKSYRMYKDYSGDTLEVFVKELPNGLKKYKTVIVNKITVQREWKED